MPCPGSQKKQSPTLRHSGPPNATSQVAVPLQIASPSSSHALLSLSPSLAWLLLGATSFSALVSPFYGAVNNGSGLSPFSPFLILFLFTPPAISLANRHTRTPPPRTSTGTLIKGHGLDKRYINPPSFSSSLSRLITVTLKSSPAL